MLYYIDISRVYVPSADNAYYHAKIIELDGIHLYGDGYGSWLHATEYDSTPVKLIGTGSAVSKLRLTSVDQDRQTVPWSTTVWCYEATNFTVDNVWVEPLPNQGYVNFELNPMTVHGVGGIFIYGCSFGIVSNNNLNFTYADAIHHTAFSHDIHTFKNTIENAADDGIACVTYLPDPTNYNIRYSENSIKNNWGGRGLTIIGGDNIIIEDNYVENTANAAIWLSSEGSYNSAAPTNSIVRRNTVRYSTLLSNGSCSATTLPAMGIDIGNAEESHNIQFVDNTVEHSCRPLLRLSGGPNNDVTVAGNTFASCRSYSVYVTSNDVQLDFIGNKIHGAIDNAFVGINTPDVVNFVNNDIVDVLTDTGRIQVVIFDNVNHLQFTGNNHSQTASTNARRYLEVNSASSMVIANNRNTTVLSYVVPSDVSTFAVPSAEDFLLPTSSSSVDIAASTFVEHASGSDLKFVVAYGAIGGKIDTSIDRSSARFTFGEGEVSGSFKFVVKSADQSIAEAVCRVEMVEPQNQQPQTTSSPSGFRQSSALSLNGAEFALLGLFAFL
jgi:hypothetical protein